MHAYFSRETLLRWLLALACFALLLFFFTPPFAAFQLWSRVPDLSGLLEVRRGVSVLEQMAHPGAVISDPLHRVIQWRLLFPLIGHVLGLSPFALFALAPLGCLLLLFRVVSLLRTQTPVPAWSRVALAVLCLSSASWFFTSTGWLGYFDAWLALGLLAVTFGASRWTVWIACLLTPWIDERFILALPLALYCRHLWLRARTVDNDGRDPATSWRHALVPAALALVFVVVRLIVLRGNSGEGATLSSYLAQQNFFAATFSYLALGIWEGLRVGWLFVIIAVAVVARRLGPLHVLVLIVALLGLGALGLATAQDYSRSITMLFPVAVLGALLAMHEIPVAVSTIPLRLAATAALLLPAHQVMNDRVNPIYYLYHELAALRSPPAAAMPELYELRAIHAMERGDYERARHDLTLAIKLARDPSSPAKQRGILSAGQGRWAEALEDFSLMVEHDNANPDAWLMRAQAHFALGQLPAAHSDFEHARSIAPTGWSQRPDVARFSAKLDHAR